MKCYFRNENDFNREARSVLDNDITMFTVGVGAYIDEYQLR